ncbi:proline--tRNA ligase [Candidatus Pacearchaeota archaeon]|nr:proline--tRNA ligase [Candidatus Pacearchaeota archaeon]
MKPGSEPKGIKVKKSQDLSEWYTDVLVKAELADYAPIRGFMVIRPHAYSLWENIQSYFNEILKKRGVKNAYFPFLIPDSFFKKEAEHAKGFAPELAYVQDAEEGEKLALRPTSETIIYDSYSKWIRSHRDLPMKLNQWCNVIRWEVKQTKPFLRTREFLWQEGHCVFASEEEADEDMRTMILEYQAMARELLALPTLVGRKSKAETFPGALRTMTIEALMPDGKALQCGTSHNLGQGFAKSFNISYKGEDEKDHYTWQTSWGFSTRLIGAIAMIHGDDKGLVLPPRVAGNKIVIVPILFEDTEEKVMKKAKELHTRLASCNPILDDRPDYSAGWKFNEWELKGIPIRVEIGPKDLEKKQVTLVRRDTGKKESVSEKDVGKRIAKLLDEIQQELYEKAEKFLKSHIDSASSIKELKEKLQEKKIVKVYMTETPEVEEKIKAATNGATSRLIEVVGKEGTCIETGKKVKTIAYFAKAY